MMPQQHVDTETAKTGARTLQSRQARLMNKIHTTYNNSQLLGHSRQDNGDEMVDNIHITVYN